MASPVDTVTFAANTLATLAHPVAVIDSALTIVYRNKAFLTPSDTNDSALGFLFDYFASSTDKSSFFDLKSKTAYGTASIVTEMQWPSTRGGNTIIRWSISPLEETDSNTEYFVIVGTDITEQQTILTTLHDTQEKLRSVIDAEQNSVITITEKGIVESFSPSAEKMFGYNQKEVTGNNINMLMASPHHEQHDTYLKNYVRTGNKKIIGIGREVTAQRKDGTLFPIFLAVDELWQGGQRYFTGIIRELTIQKQLETMQTAYQRLLETLATGADLAQMFSVLVESCRSIIPDASINIMVSDGAGKKLKSNSSIGFPASFPPAMETIANSPGACPCSECFYKGDMVVVSDIATSKYSDTWTQAIEDANFQSCWAYPIFSQFEQPIGAVCLYFEENRTPTPQDAMILKDLARLASLGIERLRDQQKLQQARKMESIGQLTGGLAHDFNNLLTVIQGNIEMVHARLNDTTSKDILNDAMEATEQGSKLTKRMLTFARRQPIDPKIMDVNATISELSKLLSRTLGGLVEMKTSLGTNIWSVEVDPGQFQDALVNFCINARDAMPLGGSLLIRTENWDHTSGNPLLNVDLASGEYVKVSITDTGTGIHPDDIEQIFDPFFTTKDTGKGSGLGLSMVFGFAKRAGGAVTVYSEIDTGTTFSLYLPRAANSAIAPPEKKTVLDLPSGSEVILVVEDDARVRKVTIQRLQQLGYTVIEAKSGEEGLSQLKRHNNVSLVFTDLIMPGNYNGQQMGVEILKHHPEIKILYTSGYADPSIIEGGQGIEEALLRKPYSLKQLADRIRQAIDS